jgi:hypothetical protein
MALSGPHAASARYLLSSFELQLNSNKVCASDRASGCEFVTLKDMGLDGAQAPVVDV